MKNIFTILLLSLLFTGCAISEKSKTHELVILHTNDHHGAILPINSKGGLAQRSTYINSVKSTSPNLLILDAGDMNTGSVVSDMFDALPDIEAYNAIGYDAVTLGNHEFDGGYQKLLKQIKHSKFKWLSANVLDQNKTSIVDPFIIKDFDGFRVGVFGITTSQTKSSSSPGSELIFENEISSAKKYIKILKDTYKADIIIALTHLGSDKESPEQITSIMLAEATSGIDLIVDGHSHTKFQTPLYVNQTAIVSANEWGKYVGKAKLIIKDKKLVDIQWKDTAITEQEFVADPKISKILNPYIEEANQSLSEVIGVSSDKFEFKNNITRYQESAIGNLVCDSIVGYLKDHNISVDFAMMNGGGIRFGLPKGEIKKEDILTALPYKNSIYVVKIDGKTLLELFEAVSKVPQGSGSFMQVSSAVSHTILYEKDNKNGKLLNLKLNSAPIDINRTYYLATNDYVIYSDPRYKDIFSNLEIFDNSVLLSQAVIDYIKSQKTKITPIIDGRITIIKQ
ncbi:MAG: 5'-nucleotidase C-terminal domain-containing protein [Campylobacter sp.]|nr:5'-nucleotidase C-terminal domain-containing protein [Campylobacter sp.]